MEVTFQHVPTKGRPQIAVRMDDDTIAELDELAELASTGLKKVSRSDVLRYVIERGMQQLRRELEKQKGRKL